MASLDNGAATAGRWKRDHAALERRLETARSFNGLTAAAAPVNRGATLRRGERLFLVAERGGLIEPNGAAVDAAPALDRGVITITNRRTVFEGQRRTREWTFSKLVEHRHYERPSTTLVEVSNRKRVSGFTYDALAAGDVRFYFDLALAHHLGTVDDFAAELERQLVRHDARRPAVHAGAWVWRGWARPVPVLTGCLAALVVAGALVLGGDGGGRSTPRLQADAAVTAQQDADAVVATIETSPAPPVETPVASAAFARESAPVAATSPTTPEPMVTCTALVTIGPAQIPDPVCSTLGQ